MSKSVKAVISALCLVLVCGLFMAASKTTTAQANCIDWSKYNLTDAVVTVRVVYNDGSTPVTGAAVTVHAFDKNILGVESDGTETTKYTEGKEGKAVFTFNALRKRT